MEYLSLLTFGLLAWLPLPTSAQVSKYQPCPLLGPYLPKPLIDPTSPALKAAFNDFTSYIESYINNGTGEFGPITPNTTSFSLALFAGDNYIPDETNPQPSFYEYHHTASELSNDDDVFANSIYAIGDLTQIFTAIMGLIEEGEGAWSKSVVKYIPELLYNSTANSTFDATLQVDWSQVTLGDLAGHMAGIARTSGACQVDRSCSTDKFLSALKTKPPIELPGTTPIYSHAAFQLLAIAIERKAGARFSTLLENNILGPLQMNSTSLLSSNVTLFNSGLSDGSSAGEAASLGLASSITDLSHFGRAILTSKLLSPAQTRRWLQPIADTSNLRNSVGRPWEIYSYGEYNDERIDPIIDIYTKTGSIERYSSYFGLAPAFDVGFTILAVDTEAAADLNAIADIVLGALLQIQDLGRQEAEVMYAGTYHDNATASKLELELTGEDSGIKVAELDVNGTDWLPSIAKLAGIDKTSNLDFRLYATDLEHSTESGKKQVFQGVIQDKSALVDAGTPTCISWMTVDELEINGQPLDRFVFVSAGDGEVIAVEWPALRTNFIRLV